jgi:hypothetical protein
MEITLTHGPNPSKTAAAFGIPTEGPYVEDCWLPVVGPSTVLFTRLAHRLATVHGGRAVVPAGELAGMLGLGRADAASATSQLGRTMKRAAQFGLGQWDRDAKLFRAFDEVAPVPARRLVRLPGWNLWRHADEMAAAATRLAGQPGWVHEAHQRAKAARNVALGMGSAATAEGPRPPLQRPAAALEALDRLRATGDVAPPPAERRALSDARPGPARRHSVERERSTAAAATTYARRRHAARRAARRSRTPAATHEHYPTDPCRFACGEPAGTPRRAQGQGPVSVRFTVTALGSTGDRSLGAVVGDIAEYLLGAATGAGGGEGGRGEAGRYYADRGEGPGRWRGHGARELGLVGEVDGGAFRSVLAARHPVTGERLITARGRPGGSRGWGPGR